MHAVMKIENNNTKYNNCKNNKTYSLNEHGPYVLIHITAAAPSTTSTAVSTPNINEVSFTDNIIMNDSDNKQFKIEKRKYKRDISSSQLLNIPFPSNINVYIHINIYINSLVQVGKDLI